MASLALASSTWWFWCVGTTWRWMLSLGSTLSHPLPSTRDETGSDDFQLLYNLCMYVCVWGGGGLFLGLVARRAQQLGEFLFFDYISFAVRCNTHQSLWERRRRRSSFLSCRPASYSFSVDCTWLVVDLKWRAPWSPPQPPWPVSLVSFLTRIISLMII